MKSERWQQVNDLFQSAVERAPEERAAFLEQACHGDERLRRAVERLIAGDQRAENFIETPAFEEAPELLTNEPVDMIVGDQDLDLAADQCFGPYEIERRTDGSLYELGRGAMGVTYRAIDKLLDRPVALKIISSELRSRSAEARERFMREARAAAALRHPNVATVYQFGVREDSGQFFYAMELVEGETLEQRVNRAGPLDVGTAVEIALQVTAALAAAGKRGLIHRDLKPANLMLVSADDEAAGADRWARRKRTAQHAVPTVKIIDFGLAKALSARSDAMSLTQGHFVGTPAFASPEQFAKAPVDVRSDIYSLGVTLWFLLTGYMLFSGRTIEAIREARGSMQLPMDELKAAHVPPRLRSLLKSMLAVDPAARPGTEELAARLRRCSPQASGVRRARIALAAAAILVLGISVFSVTRSLQTGRMPVATTLVAPEKSIAVLPFENLSDDKQNAFFADGVQDEILTRLSKIADLKVISRTSAQKYKGSSANLREIAQQLGVANILEGGVQKVADEVRVNVQLINANTDTHLWAETYDRKLVDIFAVESEIANIVADTLRAKLTGSERSALAKRPSVNPEAYELYLKGRFFWNKRTVTDLQTAIAYFEQARGRDPTFAMAYAGLANAYVLLPTYAAASPQEAYPKARAASQKALELDSALAEAHASLGMVLLLYDFDHSRALTEFKRAIELDPNYATAHQWLGVQLYSALGQFDESIAEAGRARELDPLSLIINAELGRAYLYPRRFDESIDQLRKTIELDPNFYAAHWDLAEALEAKGSLDAAIAEYKKAQELAGTGNPNIAGFLGHAYAMHGKREEALKMVALLQQEAASRYVSPYSFAIVNLGLGNKEEAIRWLEKDFEARDGIYVGLIKVNPVLDPLRGDPRFEALVRKVFAPK